MSKLAVAAQLYTVRDFMKTPEEIEKGLKKVKEIGYNAVQVSGIGKIDYQELKDMVDSIGLKICATHISYDSMKNNIDDVINQHKIWDCKYVGLGGMPGEYRTSKEGFSQFAKEASEIGRILNENGLRFIYHNHSFEFVKFDGQTGMDILFNESNAEFFDFEIDTFWVQTGGANPVDWIKKMNGRMKVVHFKDMGVGADMKPMMAEIGEGNHNWPTIIDACREIGAEWCPVEQDICQRDPFESLAISFNNLMKFGVDA